MALRGTIISIVASSLISSIWWYYLLVVFSLVILISLEGIWWSAEVVCPLLPSKTSIFFL